MRLDDQPESQNIEDRRGMGMGGGPGMVRLGGIGGLGLAVIVIIGLLLGVDPATLLGLVEGQAPPDQQTQTSAPPGGQTQAGVDDSQRHFVAQVLGSTEQVWGDVFAQNGRQYVPPRLVLFSGAVQSGCGITQSATGPFYCPIDHKVYLDTAFFRDMQIKLNAPGDFPRAYVIAHEVGHHVQSQLGTADLTADRSNGDSVRTELQADCFAGVWANRAADAKKLILNRDDIEQGINAASQIGDDRLQMRARGYVVPDSFTHGSSAQRVRWFSRGLQSGDIDKCDTFHTNQL
ncbi:MAG: neutral zinc metallopeptidase [Acetobacteraceae bacterium]|nr:neutral zinc metallopeptidase [Acetobacteraceae bacterium]